MRSLYVFAGFDFLPSPAEIGVLNYERVRGNEVFSFEYRQDWLEKYSGITLGKDLFQTPGKQYAQGWLFGCFSDALPDRWGRTLAIKREAIEAQKEKRPPRDLSSFDYLTSLDDFMRLGAFRFKESENGPFINDDETLRVPPIANVRELAEAADAVEKSDEKGVLPEERWLYQLLNPGTSLGGARPKSNVLDTDGCLLVAKYPSRSDRHDVGLWEHFSHVLAGYCGINAAQTRVMDRGGAYHILLSRRFDRTADGRRIHFASALTHLGFKDGAGASDGKGYLDIVDFILQACPNPLDDALPCTRRQRQRSHIVLTKEFATFAENCHICGNKQKQTMKNDFVITIRRVPKNIITFAEIFGFVKTNIIRIGNSRGIVIPGKLLKSLNLDVKDSVEVEIADGKVVLSPAAAQADPFAAISKGGWFDDPRNAHEISDELYAGRVNTREAVEL